MALGKKTGGRKAGIPNRRTEDVRSLVDAIFKKYDPVKTAGELYASGDPKVVATVWKTCLQYKFGLPAQTVEFKGNITHSLSDVDRAAAQNIIAKLRSD
jgi:hypothetical protein